MVRNSVVYVREGLDLDFGDLELPENFENRVSVFPLPNLVLFPGIIQGLHIFEPRYRQMTEDALQGDHLIALALLKPPYSAERLFPTICIGKIVADVKLSDGRFNILLAGIARAKIIQEIQTDRLYRRVQVAVEHDEQQLAPEKTKQLHFKIVDAFRRLTETQIGILEEVVTAATEPDIPLGRLLDLIAFGCGAPAAVQQQVLEEQDLEQRAKIVLEILGQLLSKPNDKSLESGKFPPDFSAN